MAAPAGNVPCRTLLLGLISCVATTKALPAYSAGCTRPFHVGQSWPYNCNAGSPSWTEPKSMLRCPPLHSKSRESDHAVDEERFMAEMPSQVEDTFTPVASTRAFESLEQETEKSLGSNHATNILMSDAAAKELTLFGAAHVMACLSALVYKYASLRKDGELKKLLEPPTTVDRAMDVVLDNIDKVFDLCSKEEAKLVIHALHTLRKENDLAEGQCSEWIEFRDGDSEKECVYGIMLNHKLKRCTVVFRGSSNNNDFVQDGKIPMTRRNNPVKELRGQFGDIFLHEGFEQYLFKRGNKVYEILSKVTPYMKEGYSLFCTGHSLGGALATIVGFYAAADHRSSFIGKRRPVQVYTFGSPRVGDKLFHEAFKHLEMQNKLRHARFHNRMDIVARAPTRAPPNFRRYSHVGMDITLRSDSAPTFTYAPTIQEEDDALNSVLKSDAFRAAELSRLKASGSAPGAVGKLIYHDTGTYVKRINDAKRELKEFVSLEDVYQKRMGDTN